MPKSYQTIKTEKFFLRKVFWKIINILQINSTRQPPVFKNNSHNFPICNCYFFLQYKKQKLLFYVDAFADGGLCFYPVRKHCLPVCFVSYLCRVRGWVSTVPYPGVWESCRIQLKGFCGLDRRSWTIPASLL